MRRVLLLLTGAGCFLLAFACGLVAILCVLFALSGQLIFGQRLVHFGLLLFCLLGVWVFSLLGIDYVMAHRGEGQ